MRPLCIYDSTRVSNELGAGNAEAVSLAVRVVLGIALSEGTFIFVVMILLRNLLGRVYRDDKEVVRRGLHDARFRPFLASLMGSKVLFQVILTSKFLILFFKLVKVM